MIKQMVANYETLERFTKISAVDYEDWCRAFSLIEQGLLIAKYRNSLVLSSNGWRIYTKAKKKKLQELQ